MKTYLARTATGVDSLELAETPMLGPLSAGQVWIAMRYLETGKQFGKVVITFN